MNDSEAIKISIDETKVVFSSVLESLSKNAGPVGATRLFFPNGIELIKVEVDVGKTSIITVNVTVAGKDGVPGAKATKNDSLAGGETRELQPE